MRAAPATPYLLALLLPATLAACRDGRAAAAAGDGEWPMVAKDYQNRRFSPLGQVTTANVANLRVAWTFSTGIAKGHEAAPLVAGDTMYVVTPYPNEAYAFDRRNPGGPRKWTYKPHPNAAAQGVACCDVVNRGPALW